jgi:hypothetical protein
MRGLLYTLIAGAILVGCSKKTAQSPAADATDKSPHRAVSPQFSAMVDEGLADVSKKLEAKQYEAAVGGLITLKDLPKTDKEQDAYNQRVRATWDVLRDRAAQGDQGAQANQQMLGRIMTGR